MELLFLHVLIIPLSYITPQLQFPFPPLLPDSIPHSLYPRSSLPCFPSEKGGLPRVTRWGNLVGGKGSKKQAEQSQTDPISHC